jgi:hypothetical protein
MKYLLILILLTSKVSIAEKIIRPFGFKNRQPPSTQVIKIVDFKVGLEAEQVCGYTDWTTASIKVPKHLISKEYWKNVGNQVKEAAKKIIVDISGALPGMLACNVSPTWCSVLNKNQLLAAFESQLTLDSCQILDGVANTSMTQSYVLSECIKGVMRNDRSITAGMAREECLVNPKSADGGTSKEDKIARSAYQAGNDHFNMDEFLSDLFPEKIKTNTGSVVPVNGGEKKYTITTQALNLGRELFPGIEVKGRATTRVGGTFQPTLEKKTAKEMSEIEVAIVEAMHEMFKYQDLGFGPKEVVENASSLWNNVDEWKKNAKPHPFYRLTDSDAEPTLLISPEQVLMLLPLADRSKKDLMNDHLSQVIDRITRSVANIKVTDTVSELHMRSLDLCRTSPKYQDAVSQKNCNIILEKTKTQLQISKIKRENEEQARKVQMEVSEYVDHVQRERIQNSYNSMNPGTAKNGQRLIMPWEG